MGKIIVCLSGCGVKDGSEIHEATAALWALVKHGNSYQCAAPNKEQPDVVNHATGETAAGEKRNMLIEAARIARGDIIDIRSVKAEDYDGLVFPGGLGAARNLCDFALKGAECDIDKDVERLIDDFHNAGKPICAICIAPAMLARAFKGKKSVTVTIGSDPGTAAQIAKMGAKHENCSVNRAVVDRENKLVTTPAYMLAKNIGEVFTGIDAALKEFTALLR